MSGFETEREAEIGEAFLAHGHVIADAEDRAGLDRIRAEAARLAADHLGEPAPDDVGGYLDTIHERVSVEALNPLRLAVIQGLNACPWLRPTYFNLARGLIEAVVGNELAMQRRVNLSIQMPNDSSSLLPVHADVWSGDSPYEAVLWVPLVDCFATKAMYLLEPEANARWSVRMHEFAAKPAEALFEAIAPEVTWKAVGYGQVMLFDQNLMHGNVVNAEATTRWSMNCRFKAALTPYADKKLGEFFEPVTLKPMTRVGMAYKLPGGFSDG